MNENDSFEVTIFDEVDTKLKKEVMTFKNQMKGMIWAFERLAKLGRYAEINFDDKMCVILVPRWPRKGDEK